MSNGKLTEPVGIETEGGVFTQLIERGEQVPAAKSLVFSTALDNQDRIRIGVYRGFGELARQNTHVGTFRIYRIRPANGGTPRIEVIFKVSPAGDISTEATDLLSHEPLSIRKTCGGAA